MTRAGGFSLVPLECSSCGASIAAEGLDVVYYCTACRNGYRYDAQAGNLVPVEVDFLVRADVAAAVYKPFWVLAVEIEIPYREADSAMFSGLLDFFVGSDRGGRGPIAGELAVPAFHVEIARAVELCQRYSAEALQARTKLGERIVGGRFDVDDAQKIARYAVIATEVDKPDLLRDLEIRIEFGQARLLGVPFVEQGGVTKDAFFHLVI